jgi:hypothetical protein
MKNENPFKRIVKRLLCDRNNLIFFAERAVLCGCSVLCAATFGLLPKNKIKIPVIYLFTVCHGSSFKDGEEKGKSLGSPVTLYRRGYQNTLRC